MTQDTVIIVAGGSGSRMQSDIPKQFLLLKGLPVIIHSINAFTSFNPDIEVIIGLPEEQRGLWEKLCVEYHFNFPHKISSGGHTRFHTVMNAIGFINDEGLVAIHDAARPLVSRAIIARAFEKAASAGNAVPCISVNDSFRKISGTTNYSVDRSLLRSIQTPQVFRKLLIKNAYKSVSHDCFSDDASVLEAAGVSINLTEGNKDNMKITHPSDLKIAEVILSI